MEIGKLFWELHKSKLSNYPVTRIYKKELLRKNKLKFSTELSVGEDLIFNLHAFTLASKVCVNNLASYHYMKREIPTLTSSYNPNFKEGSLLQLKEYRTFFSTFSLRNIEHDEFIQSFINKRYINLVTNLYKKNSPYTFKARNEMIKSEIFESGINKFDLFRIKGNGIEDKLFRYTYLSKSTILMNVVFSFSFFLRNNFEFFYTRARRYFNF